MKIALFNTSLAKMATTAALVGLLAAGACAQDRSRVLSIGGSVTEIVYALGEQDRLVARDTTSQFPADVTDLPDVGYMRALSAEGVLSVNPSLILAEVGSGPPETMDILSAASIDMVMVPDGYDADAVPEKVRVVADALGVTEKGEALIARYNADMAEALGALEGRLVEKPAVMFILSMRGGRVLVSGSNTAADGIITLSGAANAVADFEGYKPLTDEAIAAAAPDVILMMDRGGDQFAADLELFSHPALSVTPAALNRRVVRINGLLLLGFGPRTPDAVKALSSALGTAES